MSGTRDWDASTYDRVSGPQVEWARGVIERLAPRNGEVVLDAGCGSGRVTEMLLESLGDDGSVIAVDGSEAMIDAARKRLGEAPVRFIRSDLLQIELRQEADAVFSNAVFHWIHDHVRLFEVLHSALRPGGRLVAQCGGAGNLEAFSVPLREVVGGEPYKEHLAGHRPNHFAGVEETESALRAAGFTEIECALLDWPVRPAEPREFIRTVVLGSHLDLLPAGLREPFVAAVLDRLGFEPVLDYVRLNISARRSSRTG